MIDTLTKTNTYRKNDWNIGQQAINDMRAHLLKLQKTAAAIEYFESGFQSMIKDAQKFDGVSNLKRHYIHAADIKRRAAIRLRKSFNNLINEIQL